MNKQTTIAVLGEGAWGTALATLFARNGHNVVLWCYNAQIADEINTAHTNNRYMPGCALPEAVRVTHDTAEALNGAQWICEAIPVQYMRSVIMQAQPYVKKEVPWIITSKGIEQDTLQLPAEVVSDVLGYTPNFGVAVGPSFAREVMEERETGLLIASEDTSLGETIASLFQNRYVQCTTSADVRGAQICAAFKNVVALLVGISDGQGKGDNARALLVTTCFQNMAALVQKAGGSLETVHGLAGIGDLFLTASSQQSRNYTVGKALGAGESLQSIIKRTGFTPEGINTIHSITAYAKKYGILFDEIITIA